MNPQDQEITAEFAVEDLARESEPDTPSLHARLKFAAKTDLGRARENNEDKFEWWEPDDLALLAERGRLYAVADGMGGHAAGQIASEMALKAMGTEYFRDRRAGTGQAIIRAIDHANTLVHDISRTVPSRHGMGCTVVASVVVDNRLIVAWAGDSRAYRIRGSAVERLTFDHSLVMEQVRAGVMTEEEAARAPFRNVITRSLGSEPHVTPDIREETLLAGDVILMCSDGLTGVVTDEEIGQYASASSPSFACGALIDLANNRGGPDNITVAILRVEDLVPASDEEAQEETAVVPPAADVTDQAAAEENPPRKRGLFSWKR